MTIVNHCYLLSKELIFYPSNLSMEMKDLLWKLHSFIPKDKNNVVENSTIESCSFWMTSEGTIFAKVSYLIKEIDEKTKVSMLKAKCDDILDEELKKQYKLLVEEGKVNEVV